MFANVCCPGGERPLQARALPDQGNEIHQDLGLPNFFGPVSPLLHFEPDHPAREKATDPGQQLYTAATPGGRGDKLIQLMTRDPLILQCLEKTMKCHNPAWPC
ncbi:hypothetical protein ElyMa_000260400 [Elysia marginata]|uniref:Uncharacterized protein n=1 Tax=Elysia marginata TaxID=1093978 RepID=A0AAV4F360_9GAST|nr:hypothetical protein ElyMa_000260400 [Elysia marginata]